jgi:hypothetical protein
MHSLSPAPNCHGQFHIQLAAQQNRNETSKAEPAIANADCSFSCSSIASQNKYGVYRILYASVYHVLLPK